MVWKTRIYLSPKPTVSGNMRYSLSLWQNPYIKYFNTLENLHNWRALGKGWAPWNQLCVHLCQLVSSSNFLWVSKGACLYIYIYYIHSHNSKYRSIRATSLVILYNHPKFVLLLALLVETMGHTHNVRQIVPSGMVHAVPPFRYRENYSDMCCHLCGSIAMKGTIGLGYSKFPACHLCCKKRKFQYGAQGQ
jgi:hypothetical protein